jgi:hypothetical protein
LKLLREDRTISGKKCLFGYLLPLALGVGPVGEMNMAKIAVSRKAHTTRQIFQIV